MKYWISAAALVMAAPVVSAKALIDIDGGVGYSFNSLDSGTLANDQIDLKGENVDPSAPPIGLKQSAENGLYTWAKISLPILPDVGLRYENLVSSGTNTGSFQKEIYGQTYDVQGEFDSELDLSYLDITLTYGIPLPMASFDFGLNFRSLTGGFELSGNVGGEQQTKSAPFEVGGTPIFLPMGYLAGSFSPPIPLDLKFSGEYKTLPLGETNVTDYNLKGTWYVPLPTNLLVKMGVEGGYRNYNLTIGDETVGTDTSDFASDISFSGFFLGATAHF